MKKRIFLSLPMSGRTDEEILEEIKDMERYWLFGIPHPYGDNAIEIELVNNMLSRSELELFDLVNDVKHKNLLYLGAAITKLSQCDAILFSKNWKKARGCKIEHEVAKLYGLAIYYM